jgi:hypothetical protein
VESARWAVHGAGYVELDCSGRARESDRCYSDRGGRGGPNRAGQVPDGDRRLTTESDHPPARG